MVAAQRAEARFDSAPTLGDIVRDHAARFRRGRRLTRAQTKALRDIARCRTAALGGQRYWCEECGYERYVYHSCRNRHCPLCQVQDRAAWVEARRSELLPVPYFHQVFTLPHEFNPWILASDRNYRQLVELLFEATAATLLEFGRNHFGGQIGLTLVLHSWDQQLRPHFHLHGLVPAGALSADRTRWIAGGRKFLFPVCGLSQVFRGKYLAGFERLWRSGQLDLPPGQLPPQPDWLRRVRRKPWTVYSQPPFAGPHKLLGYLGRYTHRTAIGNERILAYDGQRVTFRYRDRADGDRVKLATLDAQEFLQRFVTHVVPDRFQRIRHYGFLANRWKQQRLQTIRQLLGVTPAASAPSEPNLADWLREVAGLDIQRCPCCGHSLVVEPLPRGTSNRIGPAITAFAARGPPPLDTS